VTHLEIFRKVAIVEGTKMSKFSDATLDILCRAGWHEDRLVDTSGYEEALQSRGYPFHPAVEDFLRHFGGLRVVHPHAKVTHMQDYFDLDASKAAESTLPEWVSLYSERVGAPLCVIGMAFRDYMVLVMDPSGTVYAGYDNVLRKVGESGPDAIEALCSGRVLSEI
jgi:hypothetical protein